MSYATLADMEARYPNRDLVQLTNEDPTVNTVNTDFLQTFLDDASDEIDAHIASRFALPLQNPPSLLTRINCELAMYHLQSLRPIHDLEYAKFQYEHNLKFLDEVSEGQLTLGLNSQSEEPADPSSPAVVEVHPGGDPTGQLPQRVFSRGSLIGF
jgi:phage gp36-like protein